MKHYIIAVVLIVALAGFGVQVFDSNTGMAITQISTVQWKAVCSQLKTESNALAAKYEGKQCYVYRGYLYNLICPNPGPTKSGYAFEGGSGGNDAFLECKDLAAEIAGITVQLEKNAEKSKECGKILYEMRLPYKCAGEIRAYPTRD